MNEIEIKLAIAQELYSHHQLEATKQKSEVDKLTDALVQYNKQQDMLGEIEQQQRIKAAGGCVTGECE